MPSTVRLHQILVAAALLVPSVLFGAAAWQSLREARREGAEVVQRTVAIMHEHARKVFETEELALSLIEERISDLPPEEVGSPFTSEFLQRVKAPMEQAVSAWIAGPDGTVLAGTQPWPPGSKIESRDFFQMHKAGEAGTYISAPFTGVATALPSFAVSRRRLGPDGEFGGTLHIAASPAYFTQFYREAAPPAAHLAMLVRADGAVLAREPSGAPPSNLPRLVPGGVLMQQIASHPDAGGFTAPLRLDQVERTYGYRKVDNYPVYVVFGLDQAAVMDRWHASLGGYGLFAAGAAATLLGVSLLALRGARAEQAAVQRLRRESAQRQAAEAQLRHSQRMDAVGQLTGGVAHDFNNLLQVVSANLELATGRLRKGGGDAGVQARLEAARAGVARGAQLTRHLLAFARRQPLAPEPLEPARVLMGMEDMLRRTVGEAVALELVIGGGLWAVRADPGGLENALLNLAVNARDAMVPAGVPAGAPAGPATGPVDGAARGRLTVEAANCSLDEAYAARSAEVAPGQYVMFAVTDTGAGMTPEQLTRATEPFYTTKPDGQGTGLGLSMVFGFAKQSGGHFQLYSEPGTGTTARLYLPRATAAAPAARSAQAAPSGVAGGRGELVLLVEDDAGVRAAAAETVRGLGYEVREAEDAAAGLALLQGGLRPALLFTDVVMPGPVTSREMAEEARRLVPGIAVLFTSGYTQNSIVHNGELDAGVNLISKPWDTAELARRLRAVLDGAGQATAPAP